MVQLAGGLGACEGAALRSLTLSLSHNTYIIESYIYILFLLGGGIKMHTSYCMFGTEPHAVYSF